MDKNEYQRIRAYLKSKGETPEMIKATMEDLTSGRTKASSLKIPKDFSHEAKVIKPATRVKRVKSDLEASYDPKSDNVGGDVLDAEDVPDEKPKATPVKKKVETATVQPKATKGTVVTPKQERVASTGMKSQDVTQAAPTPRKTQSTKQALALDSQAIIQNEDDKLKTQERAKQGRTRVIKNKSKPMGVDADYWKGLDANQQDELIKGRKAIAVNAPGTPVPSTLEELRQNPNAIKVGEAGSKAKTHRGAAPEAPVEAPVEAPKKATVRQPNLREPLPQDVPKVAPQVETPQVEAPKVPTKAPELPPGFVEGKASEEAKWGKLAEEAGLKPKAAPVAPSIAPEVPPKVGPVSAPVAAVNDAIVPDEPPKGLLSKGASAGGKLLKTAGLLGAAYGAYDVANTKFPHSSGEVWDAFTNPPPAPEPRPQTDLRNVMDVNQQIRSAPFDPNMLLQQNADKLGAPPLKSPVDAPVDLIGAAKQNFENRIEDRQDDKASRIEQMKKGGNMLWDNAKAYFGVGDEAPKAPPQKPTPQQIIAQNPQAAQETARRNIAAGIQSGDLSTPKLAQEVAKAENPNASPKQLEQYARQEIAAMRDMNTEEKSNYVAYAMIAAGLIAAALDDSGAAGDAFGSSYNRQLDRNTLLANKQMEQDAKNQAAYAQMLKDQRELDYKYYNTNTVAGTAADAESGRNLRAQASDKAKILAAQIRAGGDAAGALKGVTISQADALQTAAILYPDADPEVLQQAALDIMSGTKNSQTNLRGVAGQNIREVEVPGLLWGTNKEYQVVPPRLQ